MTVVNEWGKLRKVVLGNIEPTDFIHGVQFSDPTFITQFTKVCRTTLDDLERTRKFLELSGVEVVQPEASLPPSKDMCLPPINPRDNILQYKDHTLIAHPTIVHHRSASELIADTITNTKKKVFENKATYVANWETWEPLDEDGPLYETANILRMGLDILITENHERFGNALGYIEFSKWLEEVEPKARIHEVKGTTGHLDGNLFIVKPGLVLVYDDTIELPGDMAKWDKIVVDKNLKPRIQVLKGLEHMEKTKYNPEFTKLWFEWLNSNINETAFSLNALNLGNDIVAFPCYNKDIFDKLEKGYNIECINLDLKAIEYWDQGLHCITSELDRDGELEHTI